MLIDAEERTPPMGIDNAAELFEQFTIEGEEELRRIRSTFIDPDKPRKPRTWNLNEAAPLIGRSVSSLRAQEDGMPKDDDGKNFAFTLEDINRYRDKYGTRYRRPNGSRAMILSVFNFKGGVAKTTTAIHLAQKAAIDGLRVLVIDLDPQASASFNLGPFIPNVELSRDEIINRALMEDPEAIRELILQSHFTGIHLIPSNLHLQELDANFQAMMDTEDRLGHPATRLTKALKIVEDEYDLIILDCGPNLGLASTNAMVACNGLLVPIPPSSYDHASFVMLCSILSMLFKSLSKKLEYLRILITKNPGSRGAASVEARLRRLYGDYVMTEMVATTAEIEKASADMNTVYDQTITRNNRKTYARAVEILDAVNNEILNDIKSIWKTQADNHEQKT